MGKITRRSFLAGTTSMGALGSLPFHTKADVTLKDPIVLENDNLRVVFDRQLGSLLTFENKRTGWRMQDRHQFGTAFRMYVPLPGRRGNFITENENPLQSVELDQANNHVTFVWSHLKSPYVGNLDITLHGNVALEGPRLLVTTTVANQSKYPIESLAYPILGDVSIPYHEKALFQGTWGYAGMDKTQLYPDFTNPIGYWGTLYPMQAALSPEAQFVLIFTNSEGLYTGYHDPKVQSLVRYQFELRPGYADSLMNADVDRTLHKNSNQINFQVIQFLFAGPGQHKTSAPIVLQPYQGSWHAGADVFKEWRKTWFTPPASPAWVKDVHSWQQIQINSAEGRLLFPYKELVKYGKDCARHGVKAIQLTGWTKGGQDRGNPSHDTNPRLGTPEDLRHAIETCRKMGVEIILFNKYTWADSTTEWYKKELFRYAARDMYGQIYSPIGYDYDTPTQLSGINTRHLVPMCTACPSWREICDKEFRKSVVLNPGGILQDEAGWHGPGVYYCFSPNHGHPVPAFIFSGDLPLVESFRKQIDPDHFLMACESPWYKQCLFFKLGYFRIAGAEHIPLQRYIDPSTPFMIAATGWNDRQMINRALLYRYVISYEPHNFKGCLDDFPLTIEYGKKVDALRRSYKAYLWDGDFRDTLGASVTVGGKPHSQYTVFVKHGTNRRAVVVANPSDYREIRCDVSLPNVRRLSLVTPEEPEPKDFTGQLRIPTESAAVLLEL